MHNPGRTVQKLHISGNDEQVITSHVNALEDAFRTASFPGLPPHGLVLIRSLDLGQFAAAASPMSLSLLIDKKIQSIAGLAVCVDQEEHPAANIVWFSDTVQPLLSLIILLLENKQPKAWYWQSLIPDWHPAMNLAQSIVCIMQTTVDSTSKIPVNYWIIRLLLNAGKIEEIFTVLTPQLAIQLLNENDLFPQMLTANISSAPRKKEIIQTVDLKWIKLIKQAVDQYGENDPRTIWLAYSSLVTNNPCLENNDEIIHMITSLISQCAAKKVFRPETEIAREGKENNETDTQIKEHINRERPKQNDLTGNHSKINFTDSNSTNTDLHEVRQQPAQFQTNHNDQMDADQTQPNIDSSNNETDHQQTGYQFASGFKLSEYAGLSFVIPLLEYIAIQEILAANPWLGESNFPARIIQVVVSRLNINNQDPVIEIVPKLPGLTELGLDHFISPATWQSLTYWPDSNNNIAYRFPTTANNQSCYITDKSKRILLYVGSAEQTDLPEWLNNTCIINQQGVYATPQLADLEITTQLIFGKYLRRYAQTGLKQLVHREGHVAITKTHLDVLFEPGITDSQIRIAGLDINPGWVSWLGKVVQFHYDYDGDIHV